MKRDSYYHGDLKAVILAHAADLVAERGADGVSLRELARAAGVSHAAPAHHFVDRRGLFTALAAQGWHMLAAERRVLVVSEHGLWTRAMKAVLALLREHAGPGREVA